MRLWFFGEDGTLLIGCADCGIEFALRLAETYNADPSTTRPVEVITDSVAPAEALLRIRVRRKHNEQPS